MTEVRGNWITFIPNAPLGTAERIVRVFGCEPKSWVPDLTGLAADLAGPDLARHWDSFAASLLENRNGQQIVLPAKSEKLLFEQFDLEWTATVWLLRAAAEFGNLELPDPEAPLWLELDEHAETIFHVRCGTLRKTGLDPYPYRWLTGST